MAILTSRFVRAGFAVSALSTVLGCERVVDLQAPGGGGQLVIDARLEHMQGGSTGKQRFTLSTSLGYRDRGAPPPAHGAVVVVSDDLGRASAFVESATEPGVYETDSFVGEVGRRYSLTVDYQGERYVATATLLPVAPVDSLRVEADTRSGDSPRGTVVIAFRDPPGVKNFYQWDYTTEDAAGGARIEYSGWKVGADNLGDGREIMESVLVFDRIAAPGRVLTVTVRQTALSEETFRFLSALTETSSSFSPFVLPPANVRGNVSNVTNPSHRALGFFQAGEVVEIRRTLREQTVEAFTGRTAF